MNGGHTELKQRQFVAYYSELLGLEPQPKKCGTTRVLADEPELQPHVLHPLAAIKDVRCDEEDDASVSQFSEIDDFDPDDGNGSDDLFGDNAEVEALPHVEFSQKRPLAAATETERKTTPVKEERFHWGPSTL